MTVPGAVSAVCASLLTDADIAFAVRAVRQTIRIETATRTAIRMVDSFCEYEIVFSLMKTPSRQDHCLKFQPYT
jgi:hypothetical protein